MDTKNNEHDENNDHNSHNKKPNEEVVKNDNSNNKFLDFLKKNIVAVSLALILIIVLIWYSIKISTIEKQYEEQKTELVTESENERSALITKYESEKDSLEIRNLESSTKIFSWAVRSELMRNNTENLNQLINAFVQESGADLVQLIDPKTNIITLSSDKKFEGVEYPQKIDYALTEPPTFMEEGGTKIITPVMGLNSALGILIVQINK
ncbi:hypothetical protein ACKGJN_04540 [Gillisia sp. Q332]|uniref:hypothetical protein n=1 Tax=Gillisia xinjiangensis TaxID=3384765 RepID=UPI00391A1AB5